MDEAYEYEYTIFSSNYQLPISESGNKTKEQILLIATVYFAKNGYAAVSMRDIAKVMGIRPSSLYNHYESKEALWNDVLQHASDLYMLYFKHLDDVMAKATSFEEILEAVFYEPKRLVNVFSSYAFCLIQAEQFRNENAGEIFEQIFLRYSIDFFREWFDKCVARGLVRQFDTQTVASLIMHSVLVGLEVEVHRQLKPSSTPPYTPATMFADVERFLLWALSPGKDADSA